MHQSDGVFAAIQCLAGVYVYDYTRTEAIRRRTLGWFRVAEQCLTQLLNSPSHWQHAPEIITIASLLSMQDVSSHGSDDTFSALPKSFIILTQVFSDRPRRTSSEEAALTPLAARLSHCRVDA